MSLICVYIPFEKRLGIQRESNPSTGNQRISTPALLWVVHFKKYASFECALCKREEYSKHLVIVCDLLMHLAFYLFLFTLFPSWRRDECWKRLVKGSFSRTWLRCSHIVVKTLLYCTRKCGCRGGCVSASYFLQPPRNGSTGQVPVLEHETFSRSVLGTFHACCHTPRKCQVSCSRTGTWPFEVLQGGCRKQLADM